MLCACATRRDEAEALAASRRMVPAVVDGGVFALYTFAARDFSAGMPLSIYIEGDGHAFIDRWHLSDDPTPRRPVALELAVQDPAPNIVYIARPCQYVQGGDRHNCHPAYWSAARYAEPVVDAVAAVIDHYLSVSHARGLKLYGHSGGGAVALLVAARRTDARRVVTVAGVLDTEAWTRNDGMTPLAGSLNPADEAALLADIPQIHFAGGDDAVVPAAVARSYAARFPPGRHPAIRVIAASDHTCCWADRWPELLRQIDAELDENH